MISYFHFMNMTPSQIIIIRSQRRKKTIQTKYVEGHLWVYLPIGMSPKEEKKWINRMVKKNEKWKRKQALKNSDCGLMKRAQKLNNDFFDGHLVFSIKFVTNQNSRFGSCNSIDRTIRISERVITMPLWVQDYIIIHELAHLIYPNHSKKFWEKVDRFRYAERAKGYLLAMGSYMNKKQSI